LQEGEGVFDEGQLGILVWLVHAPGFLFMIL
jgi:hypothetical protein